VPVTKDNPFLGRWQLQLQRFARTRQQHHPRWRHRNGYFHNRRSGGLVLVQDAVAEVKVITQLRREFGATPDRRFRSSLKAERTIITVRVLVFRTTIWAMHGISSTRQEIQRPSFRTRAVEHSALRSTRTTPSFLGVGKWIGPRRWFHSHRDGADTAQATGSRTRRLFRSSKQMVSQFGERALSTARLTIDGRNLDTADRQLFRGGKDTMSVRVRPKPTSTI